jgi:hypothetical protein
MISVIDIPDPSGSADFNEMGLILPVPSTEKNMIVMEGRDGKNVQRLTAHAVEFKVGGRTAFKDRKVKIDVFVTDARFALACSKYDKGGGWVGGAGMMITANAISKARAAIRSRGKMLVGQVRYPWIQRVGSSPKAGFGSEEKLYFETTVKGVGSASVTLFLSKNVDAAQVAAEIARRAARYRLASEQLDQETRDLLEPFTSVQPLAPGASARDIRWFTLPRALAVDEESARLSPVAA